MAVVTPLNNFMGPEGDNVTADKQLPKYQSFVVVVEDQFHSDTLGAVSATSGAEMVGVVAGEFEKGCLHVVGGESRNFEERWFVIDNRSVPCLRGVFLGLHCDMFAVNSVRRLTGVSVTEDHEVGVVVFIRWQAGEHPQPA